MTTPTKVLLPIGLFMSIVIPVTLKSMFTEGSYSDFFNYSADHFQPYKLTPESLPEENESTVYQKTSTRIKATPKTYMNSEESIQLNRETISDQSILELQLKASEMMLDKEFAAAYK